MGRGSAIKCAMLSPRIRIKDVAIEDKNLFNIGISINGTQYIPLIRSHFLFIGPFSSLVTARILQKRSFLFLDTIIMRLKLVIQRTIAFLLKPIVIFVYLFSD